MGKFETFYGIGILFGSAIRTGRTRSLGVIGGVLMLLPVGAKLKSLISLVTAIACGRQWGTTRDTFPSGIASIIAGLMCVMQARNKVRLKKSPPLLAEHDDKLQYTSNLTDTEAQKGWGYSSVKFEQSGKLIKLVGSNHYPDLGGKTIPHFVDFVTLMMGISEEQFNAPASGDALKEVFERTPALSGGAKEALDKRFGAKQVTYEEKERLVRSRGGYFAYEIPTNTRLVDAVFFPETVEDVEDVIVIARKYSLNLIPRGGGTNVSNMLEVPHAEFDPRKVLSIDMTRMTKLLSIDEHNHTAEIQAGATGREVEEQLNARGYTMGHEPDSYEFSTLGGWVSTAASGMKRTRYGNIEDIILDIKMVTVHGRHEKKIPVARYAHGSDIQQIIVGSEGNFGVITSVMVKVHVLPQRQDFDSFVFKTWEDGMAFMRESYIAGVTPSACRLVDNDQFRFGHALKPEKHGMSAVLKSHIQKLAVTKIYGMDPLTMVASTMKYEGSDAEVMYQKEQVTRFAKKHGGVSGGAEGGRTGYNVTMAIAYIGDYLAQHNIIGETFETCSPWDKVTEIINAAKAESVKQHKLLGLPGQSFISSRVTQQYHSGVCIYFTYGYYHGGMDGATHAFEKIYFHLKKAVVAAGGSVSHHHGMGKLRKPFIDDGMVWDKQSIEAIRSVKESFDPENVFGVANNMCGDIPANRYE